MKIRILITSIWLLSFIACIIIIITYFNGTILLEEDNMTDYVKPLITLYSPYILGILTFWFIKPFPYSKLDENVIFRYWLAVGLTLFFNAIILFFILRFYINHNTIILDNIKSGVKIGGWLSILVGSINAYFFGMKTK
jgi:hypothetical protein